MPRYSIAFRDEHGTDFANQMVKADGLVDGLLLIRDFLRGDCLLIKEDDIARANEIAARAASLSITLCDD